METVLNTKRDNVQNSVGVRKCEALSLSAHGRVGKKCRVVSPTQQLLH